MQAVDVQHGITNNTDLQKEKIPKIAIRYDAGFTPC